MNGSSKPSKARFVENVDKSIKNGPLERFFRGKKDYIKVLAQKTADLENDSTTPLGNKELLPKTIKVSLHQQVLYCGECPGGRERVTVFLFTHALIMTV